MVTMIDLSEFEVLGPAKVRHRPTGACFIACPQRPGDRHMVVRAGHAGEGLLPTLDDLEPAAWSILRKHFPVVTTGKQ